MRSALLLAAALFSTGGAVVKGLDLSAWQVASFRSGIAALVLPLLLPAARGIRPRGVWIVGVAFAAMMILYVLANRHTTAAAAVFLQGTAPLWVLMLSPWLLKERIGRADVALFIAMATGLALIFLGADAPTETAPDPLTGNLLGAAAGFAWAATILGLRWLAKNEERGSAPAAVCAGSIVACLVTLPLALPLGAVAGSDLIGISYLGVFQIAVAYVFLTRGMRRVSAFEASLLLLVEPVLNPVWTFLFHDERPAALTLAGCAVILVATIARTVSERGR